MEPESFKRAQRSFEVKRNPIFETDIPFAKQEKENSMNINIKRQPFFGMLLFVLGVVGCGSDPSSPPVDNKGGEPGQPVPECVQGSLGCECTDAQTCDEGGMCEGGVCQAPPGCEEGTVGCGCDASLECERGAECNDSNLCVSVRGAVGQHCLMNGTCRGSAKCNASSECESCVSGTDGCNCEENESCHEGLACQLGRCISEEFAQPVPANIRCYSPCKSNFSEGGVERFCSLEGLMEGCLGDAECVHGTCVHAKQLEREEYDDSQAGDCMADVECADFQVCIQGRCISNCQLDADCGEHMGCYRKSCRIPCSEQQNDCPVRQYCNLVEGGRGYCLPQPLPLEEETHARVEGEFSVSEKLIRFSNISLEATFEISNQSRKSQEFVVKRVAHQTVNPENQQVEVEERFALPWLAMGESYEGAALPERVERITVVVPANEKVSVLLSNQDVENLPAYWEGTISVYNTDLGEREISLVYAMRPEGRWAGTISYFNQFGDEGLEAWAESEASKNDFDSAQDVANAFVQKWASFRKGDGISLEELDAVLTSTKTESWNWPSVRDACENAAYCYPYD